MYDYSRRTPYAGTAPQTAIGERPAVLGKVLGLLGFAFLFTAGGAVVGRTLGPGAFLLAVSVYLDILNLFLALLRLFGFAAGGSRRD